MSTANGMYPPQSSVVKSTNINLGYRMTLPGISNITSYADNGATAQQQPNQPAQPTQATQLTQQQQQQQQQPQLPQSSYRPLNVKDALSYLDQVKLQFHSQADVYNNFLDIMKDFKSQNIDTPGVIDRVSALFRGHPKLIDGFNTFLPEGFAIECSASDPNTIVVTTPLGKSIRQNPTQFDTANQGYPYQPAANGTAASAATTTSQPVSSQPPAVSAGSPAEFDQAITYVNKIKQRYASRPEIYKHFLENLQMYQKGVKPIYEVYREISDLFGDAPDLLEDFKLFMPDTTGGVPPAASIAATGAALPSSQQVPAQPGYMQLPPMGSFAPPSALPPQDQQQAQVQQLTVHSSRRTSVSSKGHKPHDSRQSISGQLQPYGEYAVSDMRVAGGNLPAVALPPSRTFQTEPSNVRSHASLLPGVPEPEYPKTDIDADVSQEIAFFDKAKRAIGNKQTYNEFLKFLRLYTSDVIDKDTLVEKVQGFLGGVPELFTQFKSIVGWQAKPLRIENIAIRKQLMDMGMRKAAGPSYRLLPKSQTHKPCSGRDELCWEIFNDEWIGHPVWASEESGFIAHRKNQYEEIMYRIEDERHEYDYYMEANLRTIQTLETVANRLAMMTPEEKAKFKLPANLGHTSTTIYKKVIRKIYDKDRGWEVIDALRENPAVAVPVVLKRLKQKDEEWKRAHREWNKVWREAEQKIFYKSLDHLGLAFKQMDKKLLTNKQLVNEICTIKHEQAHKRIHPLTPRPKSQLICHYDDYDVLIDVLQLICVFLKHNQTYSAYDKARLLAFVRSFVARFFFIEADKLDSSLRKRGITVDSMGNWNSDSTPSSGSSSPTKEDGNLNNSGSDSSLSQSRKRPREYDLLKDVLKRSKRSRRNHDDGHESEESDRAADEALKKAESGWIDEKKTSSTVTSVNVSKRNVYNIFCNTQVYVFFRFLDTLYRRLLGVKKIGPAADKEIKSRKETKFAADLGLIDHSLQEQGFDIKGNDSYHEAFELCIKVIEGRVEQNTFEESLRQGFLNKAYRLFTINKVIQGLLKHCHTLVTDSRCSEILLLMEKDRNKPTSSAKGQMLYRMQVRSHMHADENMFNIAYNTETRTANVTFMAVDDLTIKDSKGETKEQQWNYYMTSYAMSYPTEGIQSSKLHLPFLKSSLEEEEEDEDEIEGVSDSKLKVSVDTDTYQMMFDHGSYDLFVRNSVYKKQKPLKDLHKLRLDALKEAIDGKYGVDDHKKTDTEFKELMKEE